MTGKHQAGVSHLGVVLDGVDGWLHQDEAERLFAAVVGWPSSAGPLRVVEVGSWKGRSTITLGLAALERGDTEVIAIDPHLGDNGEWDEGTETMEELQANLDRAAVQGVVRTIRAFAHDARPQVDDGSVGVCFLDGSHRYEDVAVDIEDWVPTLVDGATIAFNDSSKPGVHRALRESVLQARGPFRNPELVRSTLFVEHRPSAAWTREDARRRRKLVLVLAVRRAVHRVVPLLPGWVKRAGNRASQRVVARSDAGGPAPLR
jgi:predicted O-methyltransferase YrrM